MIIMKIGLRQIIGAAFLDCPRYLYYLLRCNGKRKLDWIYIKNRDENLIDEDTSIGVKCHWSWTSDLYLPKLFPIFGRVVMSKAFQAFPIKLSNAPEVVTENPSVSFIIGHRGKQRLSLLLKTLESIAGQKDASIECIVIEQDIKPLIKDKLPQWVKYKFTSVTSPDIPYSRSWAFNEGATIAKSNNLIFHDNDMIIPNCYADKTIEILEQGFDFVNLKRFIFYLTQPTSVSYISNSSKVEQYNFDAIVQNLEGGGSFGANKSAYFEIGGFDERFVGWGGEDNEFWERALTKRCWEFTFLPIIHLWHSPQAGKLNANRSDTKKLYEELQKLTPTQRIENLKK